ncbi:MAG: pentapeptide repeat-containing protein [Acidobacteria bacterium]|nr:pentapeptide repeat-containing protein [Acidobacteriota bacterium]
MSNPDHLSQLEKGVAHWNEWRRQNPSVNPNFDNANLAGKNFSGANLRGATFRRAELSQASLVGADLRRVDLSRAELREADFSNSDLQEAIFTKANVREGILIGANLSGAKLSEAILNKAKFNGAKLIKARLTGTKLIETDLIDADLTDADLSDAELPDAILIGTTLDGADFSRADLSEAKLGTATLCKTILTKADFSGADLSQANLSEANLCRAVLTGADLSNATLSEADLSNADLSKAILQEANLFKANLGNAKCDGTDFSFAKLHQACLIGANLDDAILNGSWLWETQRSGWSIKGVVCDSASFEEEQDHVTIFGDGDFERIYADKTTVRLFYQDGIGLLEVFTLPALITLLKESSLGYDLRLESISDAPGGVIVNLVIEGKDNNDKSQEQLKQLQTNLEEIGKQAIEYQRQALAEKEINSQLKGALQQANAIIDKLILRPTITLNNQGGSMGDTNIVGQGIAGPNAHVHDTSFNQIQISNRLNQAIDLPELARQLADLRRAMAEKQDPSPQAAVALGEVAKAEIAAGEKDSSAVTKHLQAAGQWVLDLAKEFGKDVAVEAIKQSMGMQ